VTVGADDVRMPVDRIRPLRVLPFAIMHLLPLAALFTDVAMTDWLVCLGLYYVRMFFVTAGYHRYFSHRTFKTSRVMQFVFAFMAESSAQKGALWWAAHHRDHHKYSDMEQDIHSPKKGFWWSHVGWMLVPRFDDTKWDRIKDMKKYPELVFLNKHWWIPPTTLAVLVWALGTPSTLFIGFFLSTVFLWHGTFTINSLSHVFGSRRYATTDTSRNNALLAVVTCGEGWHNNHHHFCASANQGFFWWEFDFTYYGLRLMELFGLVWDIKTPSADALVRNRLDAKDAPVDVGMLSPADAE
jgi:stearoyl-CoA desaturase (delta-9 desaturase)